MRRASLTKTFLRNFLPNYSNFRWVGNRIFSASNASYCKLITAEADQPVEEEEEHSEDEGVVRSVQDMLAEDSSTEDEDEHKKKLKSMKVNVGETHRVNKNSERKDYKQMFQLKEKMIRRKYRNLYKSMKQARVGRQKEIKLLKYKRRLHERKVAEEKRATMQAQRMAAMM